MANVNDDLTVNFDDEDWENEILDNSLSQAAIIQESLRIKDEDVPKPEHLEVLSRCFGHKSFRPMQWKIINSIINDRRDNCAIMSTGYGKSLCYQYPPVYCGGLTIVISPLISLMEDQVLSLEMMNISACLLGTAQTKKKKVVEEILNNKYSLVYITPEFCCGEYGTKLLEDIDRKLCITLIAIDEAHCVSSWGHDFRFQYRELGRLKTLLPHVPILAVTATATKRVREDIIKSLNLRDPLVLCSGFNRPNLYFEVRLKGKTGMYSDLSKCMISKKGQMTFPGSTIIYCLTRKQTEEVALMLRSNSIVCAAYHAGLSLKDRKEIHEKFVRDKIKVVVATIAFGMGIDKPDVRNVIHYGAPKDMESYYQEVGRAGRDGQPGQCILFYNSSDFEILRRIQDLSYGGEFTKKRQLVAEQTVKKYLATRNCRRAFILNHFEGKIHDEKKVQNRCCDNCKRNQEQKFSDDEKYEGLNKDGLYDFTNDAKIFLNAVDVMGGRFGIGSYILFLRASKSSRLSEKHKASALYGSGKHQPDEWWKGVASLVEGQNLLNKVLKKEKKYTYYLYNVSNEGYKFLDLVNKYPDKPHLLLHPPLELFKLLKKKPLFNDENDWATPLPSNKLEVLPFISKISKTEGSQSTQPVFESDKKVENPDTYMNIYRKLLNKRSELASKFDCMPYMIASNEILMKMAKDKPTTIEEVRNCQLDGFTEAKLKRFGDHFVKVIRTFCDTKDETSNKKETIEEILQKHPLPNVNFGASAESTYSLFKSGKSVQEIATQRGVIASTVISHLTDAMKVGYPVKMIELNVSEEIKITVINAISNPPINGNISALKPIKDVCPPDITFDNIKVVITYLQVRNHLKNLNIPYKDFEDTEHIELVPTNNWISKNKDELSENPNKKFKLSQEMEEPQSEQTNIEMKKTQEKPTETVDLDETVLDDDYFDDIDMDHLEKNSPLSQTKTSQSNYGCDQGNVSQPSQNTSVCSQSPKDAIKKFKFKNKSVLNSLPQFLK